MNEDFNEFLEEFLNESEEHLNVINNSLLDIEKEFKQGEEISQEKVNSIFRGVHTLKGLSGMLGFDLIQALAHAMEDLMSGIRDGSREISLNILDTLFKCVDVLAKQVNEVREQGKVITNAEEFVAQLRGILNGNEQNSQEESIDNQEVDLSFLDFDFDIENFIPTEIEVELLKDTINRDLNVYMVTKEVTGGISEEKFNKLPIFNDIESVGELIFYRPKIEDISNSNKDTLFCRFIFMSEKGIEEINNSFLDEVVV
jgi:two-component system chemotaxis sensor kinase CheA